MPPSSCEVRLCQAPPLIQPDYVPCGSHILSPHLVNRKLKVNQTPNQYTKNGKYRRDVKPKKTPKINATE
jgi:hypothetical protein